MDQKIKYLEMLQTVISRLNSNAFAVKNWFMVSIGGLVAFFFKTEKIGMLVLAIIMTVAFYMYDVFYLWLERCYREKYNRALQNRSNLFDMDISDIKKKIKFYEIMDSPSLTMYKVGGVILIALAVYNILCAK